MEAAILVTLLVLIASLLGLSLGRRRGPAAPGGRAASPKPAAGAGRSCPLCGSHLEPGERVRSVFYPSPGDTLAEIYGCRYCESHAPGAPDRICPVCRKPVPRDGHVIARVFKRPEKTHIHVLGCTRCRPGPGSGPPASRS